MMARLLRPFWVTAVLLMTTGRTTLSSDVRREATMVIFSSSPSETLARTAELATMITAKQKAHRLLCE